MMLPSSLGGGNGNAKHHQQLMQSASMLPSPYNFLPSVFANTQLDVPLFRPPEPHFGAVYLSQLAAAAAMSQSISTQNGTSIVNEHGEEVAGEHNSTETIASTSTEAVITSCSDESQIPTKSDRITSQEMDNSADSDTLSPTKVNNEDAGMVSSQPDENYTTSTSSMPQMDLSKWISEFFPGQSNGASALSMAASSQRIPSMLEQMQLMSHYLSPGAVEDSFRVLAALGGATNTTSTIPTTNSCTSSLLSSPFGSIAGHSRDTYCEMCDKNFCNRYFLRTHKWKKHGVPLPGKTSSPEYNVPSLASPTTSQNNSDLPATSTGINLSPAEFLAALCSQNTVETSQLSPSKTSGGQPSSVIVSCSPNSDSPSIKRAKPDDDGNKEDEDLPSAAKVDEEALASGAGQLPNPGDLIALIARQTQENAYVQEIISLIVYEEIQGQQQQHQSSPAKHSPSGKEACEMCGQEYESRGVLQQHLLLQHNILNSLLTPFSLLPLSSLQSQQQQQQNFQGTDADRIRSSAIVPTVITPPINASRQPKKQYSTGKNYCDVCNKEVCNKYFLRTHMLKMHGIVIDEHKTVIANIDTLEKEKSGTIAFRCDICNTNVGQTRESLKQHKQEVHNVVSLPTPRGHRGSISSSGLTSTSSLSQALRANDQSGNLMEQLRCPLCDVRTTGTVPMQKHLSERHKMEMNLESVESLLKDAYEIRTGQGIPTLNGSLMADLQQQMTSQSEFSCTHCAEVFSDQVHFQLHMIHNHPMVIRSPGKSTSATVTAPDMEPPLYTQYGYQPPGLMSEWVDSDSKSANGSVEDVDKKGKRSQNVRDLAHTMIFQQGRKFNCPVSWCSRQYRNPGMLSKHVDVIHQWRLKFSPKNGRDKSRGVIASSRISRRKRRYICLFEGCKHRFWSRDDCYVHILLHFSDLPRRNQMNAVSSDEELKSLLMVNGGTEKWRSQKVSDLIGVEEKKILRGVENSGSQERHERMYGAVESRSRDVSMMPEGFGRPSGNMKPYTLQTFLMREQLPEQSSSSAAVFKEMVAHLPVRNTIREMVRVNVELIPVPQQTSPILHL